MNQFLRRIRDWHRGYYCPQSGGGVDEPVLCQCGHYFAGDGHRVHREFGCTGWARDQWLPLFSLRCRCRIGFGTFPQNESETAQ